MFAFTWKDSNGRFKVSYRPGGKKENALKEVFFSAPVLRVPSTMDELEAAFADYKIKLEVGGEDLEFTGLAAAGIRQFLHAAEGPVRGEARGALESGAAHESVQKLIDRCAEEYTGPSGRKGGRREVSVDQDAMAEALAAGPEALAAYLASRGIKVG